MMYVTDRKPKRIVVGITSRSSEDNLQWLIAFLKEEFWDINFEVKFLPITNRNRYEWEDEVRRTCSVGILYHTKLQGRVNITDIGDALYDEELKYLSDTLGKENVLVVLDDMENFDGEERQNILQTQFSLGQLSSQVILIPEHGKEKVALENKSEFLKVLEAEYDAKSSADKHVVGGGGGGHSREMKVLQSASCTEDTKRQTAAGNQVTDYLYKYLDCRTETLWNKGEHLFDGDTADGEYVVVGNSTFYPNTSYLSDNDYIYGDNYLRPPLQKYRVRIFSRSASDNYQWLINFLQEEDITNQVEVRGVYISNNHLFCLEIFQCHFAILYHTKKRGRLNITDVIDSLYDEELSELSKWLGKRNVIVVVDDLKDSSSAEKDRILNEQEKIQNLAKDVFLFSEEEKSTENLKKIAKLIKIRAAVAVGDHNVNTSCLPSLGKQENKHLKLSPKSFHESLRSKRNSPSSSFSSCSLMEEFPNYYTSHTLHTSHGSGNCRKRPSLTAIIAHEQDSFRGNSLDVDESYFLRANRSGEPPTSFHESFHNRRYRSPSSSISPSSLMEELPDCSKSHTLHPSNGSDYGRKRPSRTVNTPHDQNRFKGDSFADDESYPLKENFSGEPDTKKVVTDWMHNLFADIRKISSGLSSALSTFCDAWWDCQENIDISQTEVQSMLYTQTQEEPAGNQEYPVVSSRMGHKIRDVNDTYTAFTAKLSTLDDEWCSLQQRMQGPQNEMQDTPVEMLEINDNSRNEPGGKNTEEEDPRVKSLQIKLQEADTIIEEIKSSIDRLASNIHKVKRVIKTEPAENLEDIINEQENVTQQLYDNIQILQMELKQEKTEELKTPLRDGQRIFEQADKGTTDEQSAEADLGYTWKTPQTTKTIMPVHSIPSNAECLDDDVTINQQKIDKLDVKIIELESRVESLEHSVIQSQKSGV